MGVYIRESKENISLFTGKGEKLSLPLKVEDQCIETYDGMVYLLYTKTVPTLDSLREWYRNEGLECDYAPLVLQIEQLIWSKDWILDQDALIKEIREFMNLEVVDFLNTLGDYYYDLHLLGESFEGYTRGLHQKQNEKSMINIGLILLAIGYIQEGIDSMEKAYHLSNSINTYTRLLRCKVELKMCTIESIKADVSGLLVREPDEDMLSFLVWYYQKLGDDESCITSFLLLHQEARRIECVSVYMSYMIRTNQQSAMEHNLKDLRDKYKHRYQIWLAKTYLSLNMPSEALEVLICNENEGVKKWDVTESMNVFYLYRGIASLKLNRVIQALEFVNKVDVNLLKEEYINDYYMLLADLAKFSNNMSKEHEVYTKLLIKWRSKYRQYYRKVLKNETII